MKPRIKVLTPGHLYELDMFEGNPTGQRVQFIEKVPVEPGSTTLETKNNGTTNEAVLEMLIDRLQFLQKAFPCRENAIVITKLEESLLWLEKRTADRVSRNVEGRQIV